MSEVKERSAVPGIFQFANLTIHLMSVFMLLLWFMLGVDCALPVESFLHCIDQVDSQLSDYHDYVNREASIFNYII